MAAFDTVIFGIDSPEHVVNQVQDRVEGMWQRSKAAIERRAAAEGRKSP